MAVTDEFKVSLWYYIEDHSKSACAQLVVMGYTEDGIKRTEAIYWWGGESWNYREVSPEVTGGYYTCRSIKPQDSKKGKWHFLKVDAKKDIDKAWGNGKWDSLGIVSVRIRLYAWAQTHQFISGYYDDISIEK